MPWLNVVLLAVAIEVRALDAPAGIRATIVPDEQTAAVSRRHNNINVLCLGEKQQADGVAERIVKAFLETEFEGGRHATRVEKIAALEKKT